MEVSKYAPSPLRNLLLGVGLYGEIKGGLGGFVSLICDITSSGAYVVLFGLSMWTTYLRKETRSMWMRIPLFLM
jgi:hypothetical protein